MSAVRQRRSWEHGIVLMRQGATLVMCKNPSDIQGQAMHSVQWGGGEVRKKQSWPHSPLPGSSREQSVCGPEGHTECQCNDSGVDRPRAINGHL